jgi:hypothetical protein
VSARPPSGVFNSGHFKKGYKPWNKGKKGLQSGSNHPSWKGGVKKHNGYISIYSPNHPNKMGNNFVLKHRLVIEKYLGRYLNNKETVHHINGNPSDNRIENLILFKDSGSHLQFERNVNFNEDNIIFDGRNCAKS